MDIQIQPETLWREKGCQHFQTIASGGDLVLAPDIQGAPSVPQLKIMMVTTAVHLLIEVHTEIPFMRGCMQIASVPNCRILKATITWKRAMHT